MPVFLRANGTTARTIHIGVPSFPVALPLMRSNKPEPDSATVAAILEAGEQLLDALREEDRISKAYPKDFTAVVDYLESVSDVRKIVDERAREYFSILEKYGFPDIPIRHEIETGENRLRWNWQLRS